MLIRPTTVLLIALLLLSTFLQYRLWFESGGILDMARLKKEVAHQIAENDKLKKRNEALLLEVKHLQNNKNDIESRARDELGMIKKGETFYQVVR